MLIQSKGYHLEISRLSTMVLHTGPWYALSRLTDILHPARPKWLTSDNYIGGGN